MRTTLSIALLMITTFSYGQTIMEYDASGQPHRLKNRLAPNFKAMTLDSTEINLRDLTGKVVFLDFWSLNCAACFKELPELNELTKKYPKEKFVMISLMDNTRD